MANPETERCFFFAFNPIDAFITEAPTVLFLDLSPVRRMLQHLTVTAEQPLPSVNSGK